MPDSYYLKNLWGTSEYDIRHILTFDFLYDLPFFKGQTTLAARVLGGWQFSGTGQFQTGVPCGVGTNNHYAGVGEVGSFGCGTEGEFWVQNGRTPAKLKGFAGASGTGPKWFSTTIGNAASGAPIYTQPTSGTFNLQRGIRDNVYEPGLQDENISLIKTVPLFHQNTFEFRAEAYNFVNHPNLATSNFTANSPLLGAVTAKTTSNPRTLQVGTRYNF